MISKFLTTEIKCGENEYRHAFLFLLIFSLYHFIYLSQMDKIFLRATFSMYTILPEYCRKS
jgi:hypothetical protein